MSEVLCTGGEGVSVRLLSPGTRDCVELAQRKAGQLADQPRRRRTAPGRAGGPAGRPCAAGGCRSPWRCRRPWPGGAATSDLDGFDLVHRVRGEQVVADRPRDAVADQPGKALLVLRDLRGD